MKEADAATKQYRQQYYISNRERCIKNAKAWRQANPEKCAKNRNQWAVKNYGDFASYMKHWRYKKKLFAGIKKEAPCE
jgi:hypothetical protein